MYRTLLGYRQFKLSHNLHRRNLHYHRLGRFAVLHEHDVRRADRLNGMDLRSLRGGIAPHRRPLGIHLSNPILMGQEDMTVTHQYGIADLASLQLVLIRPIDLSILHDEHPPLLTLPGIEEIVPCQTCVNL